MKRKPKVLILCPDIPYPEKGGGQVRMPSIIHALVKLADIEIACLSVSVPAETQRWAERHQFIVQNYASPPDRFVRRLCHKLSLATIAPNLRLRQDVKHFFDRIYDRFQPDLVWVETPYLLRYALDWQKVVPVVVDYWGTSEGARRVFERSGGWNRIKAWLQWRAARRGELQYTPKIVNIVCVSESHAKYFKSIAPDSTVSVIPIGVQAKSKPSPAAGKKKNDQETMIFTGDMSFYPNVDAALFFVNDILPKIRMRFPHCKLRLAGRKPDPRITALGKIEGVEVTGFVPDLSQAIAESTIYVLPLRLGSGFRAKLLDVFSIGKAVVATSIGAEGINLQHAKNCLIADAAEDFAAACIRLLSDSQLRRRLSTAVRRLAVADYAQETIDRLIRQTMEGILKTQTAERDLPAIKLSRSPVDLGQTAAIDKQGS